jgi:LEA14-like dessication related protein
MILDGLRCARVLRTMPAVAVLLSACAATHFQAPDVTPTAVELQDAQIDQQRFKVTLHMQNPNDRALPVKWAKCALEVEGVEVGRGETNAPFNIPARGEGDVDMIVTTNLATSVPNLAKGIPDLALRLLGNGGMLSYRLSGTVNPDIAWLPPIPYSKSGQFALPSNFSLPSNITLPSH